MIPARGQVCSRRPPGQSPTWHRAERLEDSLPRPGSSLRTKREQDEPLMLWLPWALPREPAPGSQSPAAHCTGLYPRILQVVDIFLRGFYTVKLKELPLLILILRAYFAHHLRSAVTRGVWGGNRRQKSEGITPKDSSLRAPPSSPEYGELGHPFLFELSLHLLVINTPSSMQRGPNALCKCNG